MLNKLIYIYTRTSSPNTFKTSSPERQITNIQTSFTNLINPIIISEQCKADVPLKDRLGFSNLIQAADIGPIDLYMESVSRLGRTQAVIEEFMAIRLNSKYSIQVQFVRDISEVLDPGSQFDILREQHYKNMSQELIYLRTSLNISHSKAISEGKRFYGRKTLELRYPNLINEIETLTKTPGFSRLSYNRISHLLFSKGITTFTNRPLSNESIRLLINRNFPNSRSYTTKSSTDTKSTQTEFSR